MGNLHCFQEDGEPIIIVFDCVSLGTHEIKTYDGVRIKNALRLLSKRINVNVSQIDEVSYMYTVLDKNRKIREYNIPSGGVLNVKFKKDE